MYLTRIKVESWRTLRDAVELADLSPGLNVVFGPNETGKSTLMDAVCRGFFDRHKTRADDMFGRQPWGSDLGPRVTVDFAVGDARYRLDKKFLSSPESTLWTHHQGQWERTSDGQSADERVVALANGRASGSGLTKPEHWGLGQVLWACQGDATRFAVGDTQRDQLREALRITLAPAAAAGVEAEVRRRFESVFTPQGAYRTGKQESEVVRLQRELAAADADVVALDARRREAEGVSHELQSAIDERSGLADRRAAVSAELESARRDLTAMAEAHRAYERLAHDAQRTRAAWEAATAASRAITAADANAAAGRTAVADAEAAVVTAAAAVGVEQAAAARAQAARDDAAQRSARADAALAAADRLVRFLDVRDQLATAAAQVTRVAESSDRLADADRRLAELRAPSAEQVVDLRRLDRRRRDTRVRLDAASLTFTLDPDRPLTVRVDLDNAGPGEPRTVDGQLVLRADGRMVVELAGVGRLVVRGGATDAASLTADLKDLDRQWREAVVSFAADDLAELEALAACRAELAVTAEQLRRAVKEAGSVDKLRARASELENARRLLLLEDAGLTERSETPDDDARRELARLKGECRTLAAAVASAETTARAAAAAVAVAEKAHAAAAAAVARTAAVVAERDREAARLRAADGLDDAARRAALAAALVAMDSAAQRLAGADRPAVEAATETIDALGRSLAGIQDRLTVLDQQVGKLTGQLEAAGAVGLYSRWVEAAERAERLRPRVDRAVLDADAIKLLQATLDRHRRQVFEAVVTPVRHMVTTTMAQLAGPRYDRVDFDEQLRPARVHPAGRGEDVTADPDELSFGTREQLMLLVRLTLGRLLSRSDGGRHCVILDDPLVNADLRRQQAALRLMEEAAREAQVIVFTCHPHAYQSPAAKTFDLRALIDAGRPAAAG